MNYSRSGTISESNEDSSSLTTGPVPSDTQESNMKTPKDFDPYPFQRRSQRQIKKQKVSEDTINPSPTTPNPTKNPTLKTNQKTESIVKPNIKTKSIYYNLNDGYHVGDLCWTWNDGSEILWPCVVINKRKLPIQKPVTKDTDTISDTDTVTDDELDCLNDTGLSVCK
ncbi:hypothetical protein BC833DRAFT_450510 [Globomyces pollinis-pini]|nr:hypothetical protein BC833DRAFT_450510 [Globomyces pollinis-pini]